MALVFPSSASLNETYQSGSSATYQYNGQFWALIAPPTTIFVTAASASWASNLVGNNWVDAGAITITAVPGGTNPTKGTTRPYDDVRYRKINSTTYEVEYNYAQTGTTGAAAGSLQYLFTLPAGITWGAGVTQTTSDTLATYVAAVIPTNGQTVNADGRQRLLAVVPYNSTQFRMIGADLDGDFNTVRSNYYGLTTNGISYKVKFYTTV
jgi:hypothetical protein